MNQKKLIQRLCEEGVNHLVRGGNIIVASSYEEEVDEIVPEEEVDEAVPEDISPANVPVAVETDVPAKGINDKIETNAEIVHSKWSLFDLAENEIRKVWTDTPKPEKKEAVENLRLVEAGLDKLDSLMKYEFSTNYFSKKMNEQVTANIIIKIGTNLSL